MKRLETLILESDLVRSQIMRIVFTPIHGTGGVSLKPMLKKLGFISRSYPSSDRFEWRVSDRKIPTRKMPRP